MSGTSADGVDVAIVDLDGRKTDLLAFATFPYPAAVRRKLFELFEVRAAGLAELGRLNVVVGELFASALIRLADEAGLAIESIDLIGSHGQTVCHDPAGGRVGRYKVGSTLQIGEPCVIAERTGITTVADFRPRDMAAGGQGAPLVPYADYLLFADKRTGRAIQNIGGIANVTYRPAGGRGEAIVAFDTGPGNMVIDHVVRTVSGGRRRYDAGGRMAAKGRVNRKLLARLMDHRFLRRRPPKSTGREEFGADFAAGVCRWALPPTDLIATVTAFTARSIALSYRRFLPQPVDEVILCGGGARNETLVDMLRQELSGTKVLLSDQLGISADAKEAVSFAILARQTIRGLAGNVRTATGADRAVVLGKIVPG